MNLWRKVYEQQKFLDACLKESPTQKMLETYFLYSTVKTKLQCWREQGEKVFVLSKELIEAFMYTDIPFDLRPGDFHYPFNSFMIEGIVPLFQTENPHGISDIFHLLYVNRASVLGKDSVTMKNSMLVPADKIAWDSSITGIYLSKNEYACFDIDGLLEQLTIHMKDDETIGACFDTENQDRMLLPLSDDDKRNAINLLYNFILYLNDPSRDPAETEIRKERTFKESKDGAFKKQEFIFLRPPKHYASLSEESFGKKIEKRFIVRGFWRNQAYGERMSMRKHIWIKPYMKGSKYIETTNKAYVLK